MCNISSVQANGPEDSYDFLNPERLLVVRIFIGFEFHSFGKKCPGNWLCALVFDLLVTKAPVLLSDDKGLKSLVIGSGSRPRRHLSINLVHV